MLQQVRDDPRFPEFKSWAEGWLEKTGAPFIPAIAPAVAPAAVMPEWNIADHIEQTGQVSDEFRKTVIDSLEMVPDKLQIELDKAGQKVKIGPKLTDIYPELKGRHPKGWPAGATWDSSEGICRGSLDPSIAETFRPIKSKTFIKSERIDRVVLHEYGHSVDTYLKNNNLLNSSSYSFTEAYRKDIITLKADPGSAKLYLSYYMQAGPAGKSECFADLFASLFGKAVSNKENLLAKTFSRTANLMETYFKNQYGITK